MYVYVLFMYYLFIMCCLLSLIMYVLFMYYLLTNLSLSVAATPLTRPCDQSPRDASHTIAVCMYIYIYIYAYTYIYIYIYIYDCVSTMLRFVLATKSLRSKP